MGEPASRVRRYRRQSKLVPAAQRPGRAVSPSTSRASGRRTRLAPHSAPRARAPESRAPACVCAAAGRDDFLLARRSDLGRLDPATRRIRTARAEEGRKTCCACWPICRPMGTVGPVPLTEVRDVLADRLRSLEVDPPANRYGRVFVGSPHQARGRSFKVVFVPGLAERLFPQKLREDPLLLDDAAHELAGLSTTNPIAPTSNGSCCAWRSALPRSPVRVVPAHRNLRSPGARAVVLCAGDHARRHRPRARPPTPRTDGGAGVAREPRLAGARRRRRCHRRSRARPVGAPAPDAERRRHEGTCALHAHAERLPPPFGHRALGAGGEALVAVRRPRARHRRDTRVFCRPSGSTSAPIPCRRFRNTPRVRISSFCRLRIASRRSKSPSRCSAWIRSRKGSLFHQVQAEFFRALQKAEALRSPKSTWTRCLRCSTTR